MKDITKEILAEFDYNFKHTDKNEVGYVPVHLTEKIKTFLEQAISKAVTAERDKIKAMLPDPESLGDDEVAFYLRLKELLNVNK